MRRLRPQGGVGDARRPMTSTAGELEGSGTEDAPGGAVAGGGATSDATFENAAAAGARGCHGEGRGEREGYAGRRENPTGKSSGVGNRQGATGPLEWQKTTPGGVAK